MFKLTSIEIIFSTTFAAIDNSSVRCRTFIRTSISVVAVKQTVVKTCHSARLLYSDDTARLCIISDKVVVLFESTILAINNNTFTFTMPAADVKVQASFDKIKYDVKVAEVTGGKATIAETSYAKDDIVEVAIAPAEGYAFKSLTVKNGDTELELETITNKKKYSFKMTNAAVNVEPAFEKISYDVKFGEMTNGTVEADKAKATIGDTVTLTVKPDSGYILDTLTVMNGSKEVEYQKKNATTYTFTMPASKNVLVSATYKVAPVEYEVTYDGGDFVNIRETASKTGTDLGDIPNGTVLEALEVTSEWVKVQYKDITGWVAMLNLTKVTN